MIAVVNLVFDLHPNRWLPLVDIKHFPVILFFFFNIEVTHRKSLLICFSIHAYFYSITRRGLYLCFMLILLTVLTLLTNTCILISSGMVF